MAISKHYPQVNYVRYADDAVVPCTSKAEAEKVLEPIKHRLAEVKLQIKEEKKRIAYGKDYWRKARHEVVKFEFLGFGYQPRARKGSRDGKYFTALENGLPLKRIKNNTSRMTGDCHVQLCVQVRLVCSGGIRPSGVRNRSPVAWMAGKRETEYLKPIYKAFIKGCERVPGP